MNMTTIGSKVFSLAVWHPPLQPTTGEPPSIRTRVPRHPPVKQIKLSFAQKVERAAAHLASHPSNTYLGYEHAAGGRHGFFTVLTSYFQEHFGAHGESDNAEQFRSLLETETDAVLTAFTVGTLQRSPAMSTNTTDRKRFRLSKKRPAEQLYLPPAEHPPSPPPPIVRVRGVRQKKADHHRYRMYQEGDYACTMCNRVFPSGGSLANHVRSVHTEGTFREAGFNCPCCPRVFQRLSGRTWHLEHDHAAGSTALTCPHCHGVFPGKPMLLLHFAQDHPLNDTDFPSPCPLCVKYHRNPVQFMRTPLIFKRHRTHDHLHDIPITVHHPPP